MSDSILVSVKDICNISDDNNDFDDVLLIYINGALSTLWQLGTFSGNLHSITGSTETWDMLETDESIKPLVIEYVSSKTRLDFDPPQSTSLRDALANRVDELEFRINSATDPTDDEYTTIVDYFESKESGNE